MFTQTICKSTQKFKNPSGNSFISSFSQILNCLVSAFRRQKNTISHFSMKLYPSVCLHLILKKPSSILFEPHLQDPSTGLQGHPSPPVSVPPHLLGHSQSRSSSASKHPEKPQHKLPERIWAIFCTFWFIYSSRGARLAG